MGIKYLKDLPIGSLAGQRVLVRVDFNFPVAGNKILSAAKLTAFRPSLALLQAQAAKIILVSHFGRPAPGRFDAKYSFKQYLDEMSKILSCPLRLVDYQSEIPISDGECVLLENTRFNLGEESNDLEFAKLLASLAQVFVMDAFASAHRAHASTVGVASLMRQKYAGLSLALEIENLDRLIGQPKHGTISILGGSKIAGKLALIGNLLDKSDLLILGGGMANTFLAALGHNIGASLFDQDLIAEALNLWQLAKSQNKRIVLPIDCITQDSQTKLITELNSTDKIMDIGPKSVAAIKQCMKEAKNIMWNGPLGVFEQSAFGQGTLSVMQALAESSAFTLAGGGETVAALEQAGLQDKLSYVSTGGGAFLEYMAGDSLVGIRVLASQEETHA